MNTEVSRSAIIRGHVLGRVAAIRPPWAIPEHRFTDICTRCDDCITACPERVITTGPGGFPAISFDEGACTFCGDCLTACAAGALRPGAAGDRPWHVEVRVGDEDCLGAQGVHCRLCDEQCEAGAIGFTRLGIAGVPRIDIDLCTGCGACIGPCPVDAITARPGQPPKEPGEQAA